MLLDTRLSLNVLFFKRVPIHHFNNFSVYFIYLFSSFWFNLWSFLLCIISIYKGLMLGNTQDYGITQTDNQRVHTIKTLT